MRVSKVLASFAFAVAVLQSLAPASAQEGTEWGVYLRGDLGWSFIDWGEDNDGNAFIGGGGIGYTFNDYFRADLRVDWTGKYEFESCCWWSDTYDFITTTGNVYVDIPIDLFVTPYLGAGLGYTSANSDTGFTVAGMAGLAVEVTENVDIDLGFRFLNISADEADIQAFQGFAGLRFGF